MTPEPLGLTIGSLFSGIGGLGLEWSGLGSVVWQVERSGLWFEYLRIVHEIRPRVVIVENVAALLARGLDVVKERLRNQ